MIFYSMFGTVKVKNTPEVKAIVDRFDMVAPPGITMTICEVNPSTAEIEVSGGGEIHSETVNNLVGIVKELSPFTLEATYFCTNDGFGNEAVLVYVGLPGCEGDADSADALEQVSRLIEHLNAADALKLVKLLTPKLS